ncbi:MAG: integrase core domain-containing protein, partial [Deltaproteobacteria bacterium]|nr:integrase core domain-containing protein [Candidatus Kapabacteria bacterium]
QQLTITALWKAWKNRSYATGMLIHSDRGSQYAATGYRQFLTDYCKATQSMSRKGNCWDNAPLESFFATLKTEEFNDINFVDLEHVQRQAAHYIENIYNRRRLHSTLEYSTPVDFENNDVRNQKHLH